MKKLILIVGFIILLLSGLYYYRFSYSTDEKVDDYYHENEKSFNLLKDEISFILKKNIAESEDSLLLLINKDVLTDFLKRGTKGIFISFWIHNLKVQEIYFDVEFQNYIGKATYVYSDFGIRAFETSDGIVQRKIKNEEKWGVLRDRRKYGLLPIYE